MKEPFKEFRCDVCGKTIPVEDAMLQWLQRKKDNSDPFPMTLVDIHICCNRKPCDAIYEHKAVYEDMIEQWNHLEDFIGANNLDDLLTFPIERTIPEEQYTSVLEIMRRLTIPYYEEARQFFSRAAYDGYIEDLNGYKEGHISWRQDRLKNIIRKYSAEEL